MGLNVLGCRVDILGTNCKGSRLKATAFEWPGVNSRSVERQARGEHLVAEFITRRAAPNPSHG